MAYRLNYDRVCEAAEALGDMNDTAIRARTGISLATFSRLRNGEVEPGIRYLDVLSEKYGIPLGELYQATDDAPSDAVA